VLARHQGQARGVVGRFFTLISNTHFQPFFSIFWRLYGRFCADNQFPAIFLFLAFLTNSKKTAIPDTPP
jgi:hypothetical protein